MPEPKYDNEAKLDAVALYYTERDFSAVGKKLGIPHTTIRYWGTQEWWTEAMNRLADEFNRKLDTKFRTLMMDLLDKARSEIDSCKTYQAIVGASILFDKRQVLNHQPTSISGKSDTEARLKVLGAQMKKVNKEITQDPVEENKEGPVVQH